MLTDAWSEVRSGCLTAQTQQGCPAWVVDRNVLQTQAARLSSAPLKLTPLSGSGAEVSGKSAGQSPSVRRNSALYAVGMVCAKVWKTEGQRI